MSGEVKDGKTTAGQCAGGIGCGVCRIEREKEKKAEEQHHQSVPLRKEEESVPQKRFPSAAEVAERQRAHQKEEFIKWEKKVADALSSGVLPAADRPIEVEIPFTIAYCDLTKLCNDLTESGYSVEARDENGDKILLSVKTNDTSELSDLWEEATRAWAAVVERSKTLFDSSRVEVKRSELRNGSNLLRPVPTPKLFISVASTKKKDTTAVREQIPARPSTAWGKMLWEVVDFFKNAPRSQLFLVLIVSAVLAPASIVHRIVMLAVCMATVYRLHRWWTSTPDAGRTARHEMHVQAKDRLRELEKLIAEDHTLGNATKAGLLRDAAITYKTEAETLLKKAQELERNAAAERRTDCACQACAVCASEGRHHC